MKRRDLILASAGIAGGLVPVLARAAKPCPPPQVTAQGGTSASTTCTTTAPSTFSTSFGATENPISEGGAWARLTTSYWHNVRTIGGNAVPSSNANSDRSIFDDCYSRLTGSWGPDQELVGTIYKGNASEGEVELCFRATDTASSISLYECTFNVGGQVAVARWNGPAGNWTLLGDTSSGLVDPGGLFNGDRVKARIVGFTITAWYARAASPNNWILIGSVTDNSGQRIASGNPAIGFFARAPLSLDYGFQDLSVTQL